MKKLVLTSMAMVLGAVLAHAQGTITIASTVATAQTNNYSGSGPATAAAGSAAWDYEVLDMSQAAWGGLSANQQTAAYGLSGLSGANLTAAIGLWSDAAVSGTGSALHAGGINSSANGVAAGWAAPTGATYTTGTVDYYTVLGWNSSAGNWATILAALQAGTQNGGALWFGQTTTPAYNYSGGGPSGLPAVGLFGASGTGLAGSGGLPTVGALILGQAGTVPEPATLALAGLGGISMLFLRRRKA